MRSNILPALVTLFLVAGCVRPDEPAPAPTPTPAAAPEPVPALPPSPQADWRDRPYSPGDWSYGQDGRGSLARFGPAGIAPEFAVRCERATRAVRLMRSGTAAPGAAMRVQTSTGVHAYATAASGGTTPASVAEVPARDAGLDAMTFSRGRFIVSLPGTPDLILPARPEMARVVEDCRA